MKKFLATFGGKIAAALAVLVIGIVLVVWFVWPKDTGMALTILLIAVVLVALWFAIDWAITRWQRGKQARFDATIAAREGIDDRRREWQQWTAELKKQGIDRYALPMYMLLGEPQSGKSVLLHNSDLHFPFGQNRLSGIGGTRGCDWWFTEEAVILDLAGRLFTHEGGKSDEAEWNAFLELVRDFRPQCPANGVILVIPCDALLTDTPEKTSAKAARMQNALVALTSKLEARLPVYVALTKGDKVFGFAETFHRLDAQKRQEMLGWSRAVDKVETPFDPAEARVAFDELVARTRLLRADMLVSERLPEGISAVDRMYAFPNELAAAYPNFALYLQKIFTETALVDLLFFRGFYLTSGLQTGAPIAKVCAELLGVKCEADQRNLESLFTKQRAYFIKDLVKKRIFAERGLVRPTRRRVVRARRNAILGYGFAALVGIAAIWFSIVYVGKRADDLFPTAYADAYDSALGLKERRGIDDALAALHSIDRARGTSLDADAEEMWRSWQNILPNVPSTLSDLGHAVFDHRLVPALMAQAEETLHRRTDGDAGPRDVAELRDWSRTATLLLGDLDLSEEDTIRALIDAAAETVPGDARERVQRDALEAWRAYKPSGKREAPKVVPARVLASARKLRDWWNGVLDERNAWYADGDVGLVLACRSIRDLRRNLLDYRGSGDPTQVLDWCERYSVAYRQLVQPQIYVPPEESSGNKKGKPLYKLTRGALDDSVDKIAKERNDFVSLLPSADRGDATWPTAPQRKAILAPWGEPSSYTTEKVAKDSTFIPSDQAIEAIDPKLQKICEQNSLSRALRDPALLPEALADGVAIVKDNPALKEVFRAKCMGMNQVYGKTKLRTWSEVRRELGDGAPPADSLTEIVAPPRRSFEHLARVRAALANTGLSSDVREWSDALDRLMQEGVEEMRRNEKRYLPEDSERFVALDDRLRSNLALAARSAGGANSPYANLAQLWIGWKERLLIASWKQKLAQPGNVGECVGKLVEHLDSLQKDWPPELFDAQHATWLSEVERELGPALESSAAELRNAWKAQTLMGSFEGVIAALSEETDPRGLEAHYAKQTVDHISLLNSIPAAPDKPELSWHSSVPRIDKQFAELRRYVRPTSSGDLDRKSSVQELRVQIAALRRGKPAPADVLGSLDKVRSNRPRKTEIYGGPYELVDELFTRLEEVLSVELRTQFVADWQREIVGGGYWPLVNSLFARDEKDLARIQTPKAATIDQVSEVFGPKGRLTAIFDRFRLRDQQTVGVFLGPKDDWGAFIGFVRDFQRFLLESENKLRAEIKVELKPETTGQPSLWTDPAKLFWCYSKNQRGEATLKHCQDALESKAPFLVTWGFEGRGEARFFLYWTDEAKSPKPGEKDFACKLDSPLAPFLLAWSGTVVPGDGKAKSHWLVKVRPSSTSLTASLRVSFVDLDLPPRPDTPVPDAFLPR